MKVRAFALVGLLLAVGERASAQVTVIDPANLSQAVLIAQRAQQHYQELQAQYATILRMSQGDDGDGKEETPWSDRMGAS